MTVPDGPADTATFAMSIYPAISLSEGVDVSGITFNADASAYTITIGTWLLRVSGMGIINNSGTVQNFETVSGYIWFYNSATAGISTVFTNSGLIEFNDTSTAGNAGITNNAYINFYNSASAGNGLIVTRGGTAERQTGGSIMFNDTSTAANGTFTVHGNEAIGAGGGNVYFFGNSSAGNGTFTINGNAFSDDGSYYRGFVAFLGNSTADNALITVNGSAVSSGLGGVGEFAGTSSAGNATLIANAGSGGGNGGAIEFFEDATGGTSRVEVLGNGHLDISVHYPPGITIGSIEGTGDAFLGAQNLTVGSNNLSTDFSGVIQDGGIVSGIGGSLTKVGPGSLTLSGANTYTGATIVNAGKLLISSSSGSGTGTSAVTVNNMGSVLGGTGTIGGPVTVNTGAALLGGNTITTNGALSLANDLTLNSGSTIQLVLGGSGVHSSLRRTGGTWTFAPNQNFTFLDLGAEPGVYDNIITGLAGDPGGTASWTITDAGFAGTFTYDGAGNIDLNITSVSAPALQLTAAVSRKTHGLAEAFDINLLSANFGPECRNGQPASGDHTFVFTFTNNVTSGSASVTAGTGSVAGSPTFAGNTMTVNLSGVTNPQKITVTLSGVTDVFSQGLPPIQVSANMLIGDTTANKAVNSSDISQTKSQSGQTVNTSNFRQDVTVNGAINSSDISLVKSRSGTALP